jgi:glyoxylase-like metal-dependent hydrolase (beta-lactamase superfamily II)
VKNSKTGRVLSHNILNVKVFLIQGSLGYFLVDTGIPGRENHLEQAFRSWGIDPGEIKYIILTHGHLDHIGCLAHAKKITGARVICQLTIVEQLTAGGYEQAVARVWYWKMLTRPVSKLLGPRLESVIPDLVVDDALDLAPLGLPGRITHTPGHSPGSCSILLESGPALIGDLVRLNRKGEIDTGLFYDDRELIFQSLERVLQAGPELVHLSHGGNLPADELRSWLERVRSLDSGRD